MTSHALQPLLRSKTTTVMSPAEANAHLACLAAQDTAQWSTRVQPLIEAYVHAQMNAELLQGHRTFDIYLSPLQEQIQRVMGHDCGMERINAAAMQVVEDAGYHATGKYYSQVSVSLQQQSCALV